MSSPDPAISVPTAVDCARALNGRGFSTLTEEELIQYRLFRDEGLKFGVTITVQVLNSCDQIEDELAAASLAQRESIYRRERTQVGVAIAGSPWCWG